MNGKVVGQEIIFHNLHVLYTYSGIDFAENLPSERRSGPGTILHLIQGIPPHAGLQSVSDISGRV